MALHIADPEVSRLAADLAALECTTKTEALRRVLRDAVKAKQLSVKRQGFREVASRIIADARKQKIQPVTKEEIDNLWGMDEMDGN